MFDPKTLEEDRERRKTWAAQFENIKGRFVKEGEYQAETYSGIPLKPLYTAEDVEHIPYSEISVPGQFP